MAKSTKNRRPGKPYPTFPLTPHPTNRWCKKMRGKLHYFGPLEASDAALTEYLRPEDFNRLGADFSKGRGPVSVGNLVRLTRVMFK